MTPRLLSAPAFGTLLALMGLATPSVAGGPTAATEEVPVTAEMPVATNADWHGLYAGISFAKTSGGNSWYVTGMGPSTTEDFSGNMTSLTLGHDWQRGNLVYGLGLTYGSGHITANPQSLLWFCDDCETSVSKMASLRGRIGFAMDKTLVYATGGIVRADAEATIVGNTPVGSDTLSGTIVGLGVEQLVGENFSISAEYTKTDLGRLDLPSLCSVATCYTDIKFDQAQLGLNFRW